MKQGRDVHVPKTKQAKKDYREYIETLNYDPTIEEDINFSDTSHIRESSDEASSVSTRRPVSLSDDIKDYISENWLTGLVGGIITIVVLIGVYLVYDSKVAFTKFETTLTYQGEDIKEIKNSVKENNEKIVANKIKLQGNNIKLESLEKEVEKNDLRVDKILNTP